MPKTFVKEPFCAEFQKKSGSEKVYGKEDGGVSRLAVDIFCLNKPKTFVGDPFCDVFQKTFGRGQVYG